MAEIKLQPQQEVILKALADREAAGSYQELAKEVNIGSRVYRAQLTRLERMGLVQDLGDNKWQITEGGVNYYTGPEEVETLTDIKATPKQIFETYGKLVGVEVNKIPIVSSMVWTQDSFDLDWVWKCLTRSNISIELRRFWISSWQAYLAQEKPELLKWEPPTAAQEKAIDKVGAKKIEEKGKQEVTGEEKKEYTIISTKHGEEPIKVGEVGGMYTFQEARETINLRMVQKQMTGMGGGESRDKVSEIIAALAPLLKQESKGDDRVYELLKETMTDKLTMAMNELESRMPQQGEKKPWYEQLPAITAAITAAAPLIRAALGLPDATVIQALAQNKGDGQQAQPLQMLRPDGSPMVFTKDMMDFWKFNSEQKREEEKHKQGMEMMGGVRDFLGKIATAAGRMATSGGGK